MEINKQSHAIFWLNKDILIRSYRYQPVKTRMLICSFRNNLTLKIHGNWKLLPSWAQLNYWDIFFVLLVLFLLTLKTLSLGHYFSWNFALINYSTWTSLSQSCTSMCWGTSNRVRQLKSVHNQNSILYSFCLSNYIPS